MWSKGRHLVGAISAIRSSYIVEDRQLQLLRHKCWLESLFSDPRYQDPRSLISHGFKVYSQNDEDGIIEAIFARIGDGTRQFVEIGVGNGLENNTAYLMQKGWSGGWIDADPVSARYIISAFSRLIHSGRLQFLESFVTAENIDSLLESLRAPPEFDLLSLDIDGNEWWVWNSLRAFKPRVVVVEYNAGLGPTLEWLMPYEPTFRNDGTRAHGASLAALERLARDKGYRLVGCSWAGVNAFFVREDLIKDHFLTDHPPRYHFEPPKYYFGPFYGGYPANPREFCAVPDSAPLRQ